MDITQETIDAVNKRIVWKKHKRTWAKVDFMQLTSGCEFKLYEEDGTPVLNNRGTTEFIAAGKPYVDQDGMNRILVYRQ
jgi:hypothetical protein